jgi:hypothetical protein
MCSMFDISKKSISAVVTSAIGGGITKAFHLDDWLASMITAVTRTSISSRPILIIAFFLSGLIGFILLPTFEAVVRSLLWKPQRQGPIGIVAKGVKNLSTEGNLFMGLDKAMDIEQAENVTSKLNTIIGSSDKGDS